MNTKVFATITAIIVTVIMSAIPAMAQETPKVEVFGGYSFAKQGEAEPMHGFNASVTGNVNRWFGITGEISRHTGTETTGTGLLFNPLIDIKVTGMQYRVGPKFTFRSENGVAPFIHVLAGAARVTGGSDLPGVFDVSAGTTVFSAAGGGGIDIPVGRNFAIRAIQADYNLLHSDLGLSHGVRLGAGVVVRF